MKAEQAAALLPGLDRELDAMQRLQNAAVAYRDAIKARRNLLEIHSMMDTPGSLRMLERDLASPEAAAVEQEWRAALAAFQSKGGDS